ncbi:MAG: hypothetical protein AABX47_08275 [Nanoarchaeota archaeon]
MNTKLTCGSSLLPIYRMFLVCIPIILMIAPHALSLDHIYEVNIIYNHSTLNYSDLTVRPALPSMQLDNPTGQYLATVIAWNGTDLTKTRFGIPRIIFYDRFDPQTQQAISGGQIEIENTQITLRLPYFENAERIEISGPNITRKLVIPVSTFSKRPSATQSMPQETKTLLKEPIKTEKTMSAYLTNPGFISLIISISILILILLIYRWRRQATK